MSRTADEGQSTLRAPNDTQVPFTLHRQFRNFNYSVEPASSLVKGVSDERAFINAYDVPGSVLGVLPASSVIPRRTPIHLGRVHESPSIEQAEPVLVAVAEAGLVGDPVRAAILILRGQGSRLVSRILSFPARPAS